MVTGGFEHCSPENADMMMKSHVLIKLLLFYCVVFIIKVILIYGNCCLNMGKMVLVFGGCLATAARDVCSGSPWLRQ